MHEKWRYIFPSTLYMRMDVHSLNGKANEHQKEQKQRTPGSCIRINVQRVGPIWKFETSYYCWVGGILLRIVKITGRSITLFSTIDNWKIKFEAIVYALGVYGLLRHSAYCASYNYFSETLLEAKACTWNVERISTFALDWLVFVDRFVS